MSELAFLVSGWLLLAGIAFLALFAALTVFLIVFADWLTYEES